MSNENDKYQEVVLLENQRSINYDFGQGEILKLISVWTDGKENKQVLLENSQGRRLITGIEKIEIL